MKLKTLKLATLACMALSILSCSTDEDPGSGGDGGQGGDEAITLDCSYSDDFTLTDHNEDGIDYIVDCELQVREGQFTIEPGTTIQFRDGAGLEIAFDGILRAQGTSASPIRMIGTDSGRSSWKGIYINSDKGANILDYVQIEDAGDGDAYGIFTDEHAAVTFHGRMSMTNCIITNSGSNGVLSEESLQNTNIDEFANNTITGCSEFPLRISQNRINEMDLRSCTLEENGENMIAIQQKNSDRLNTETTFEELDIPYFIVDGFELWAPLTLEAGVEIVMGNNTFLNPSGNGDHYLLIRGTQSNHVTIRGKEALSGYWKGILITQNNSLNLWEFLDLSDGGGTVQGNGDLKANIILEWGGTLTANNCTSSRSGGECDIVLHDFIENPTFINNSPQIATICEI